MSTVWCYASTSGHVVLLAARAQFEMIGWICFRAKAKGITYNMKRVGKQIRAYPEQNMTGFWPYNGWYPDKLSVCK
jgi:hypothetical protein